jgi:hypothetical protein
MQSIRIAARCAAVLCFNASLALDGHAQIALSEVFYDATGSDDGREWIELVNVSATPVELGSFSLGWGGSSYLSGKLALTGVVAPGDVFVVGGPLSDAANASPIFDLAVDLAPDLQNSGATADGVALFDVPAEELLVETIPLDAVLYGETNDSGLLGPFGVPSPVHVADAPGGSSIERGLDGVWRVQPFPTPGTRPVPEPSGAALGLAGVAALSGRFVQRRRAARSRSCTSRANPAAAPARKPR